MDFKVVSTSSTVPTRQQMLPGKMIGETLVTHQTGEEGKQVNKVMVADAVDIEKEYYLAILMDRESRSPVIVASTEGGV